MKPIATICYRKIIKSRMATVTTPTSSHQPWTMSLFHQSQNTRPTKSKAVSERINRSVICPLCRRDARTFMTTASLNPAAPLSLSLLIVCSLFASERLCGFLMNKAQQMFMKCAARVRRETRTPAFVKMTNIYTNVLFCKLSVSGPKNRLRYFLKRLSCSVNFQL